MLTAAESCYNLLTMKKSTRYPRNTKDIKGKVAVAELIRSHWIIAILAIALAWLLVLESMHGAKLNWTLSMIAVALLALVAVGSLATAVALSRQK